jgi:hypothetical protein
MHVAREILRFRRDNDYLTLWALGGNGGDAPLDVGDDFSLTFHLRLAPVDYQKKQNIFNLNPSFKQIIFRGSY